VSVETDGSVVVTLIAAGTSATSPSSGTLPVDEPPTHGSLDSVSATSCAVGWAGCWATVTYTPDTAFAGDDQFTYKMAGGSISGTVAVHVAATTSAPTTGADATHVAREDVDAYGSYELLANDTDPDGDSLTAQLVTQAAHGTATVYPDGAFRYVGDPDYSSLANGGIETTDTFSYRASDGVHLSSPRTIVVHIFEVNDPPRFTSGGDVTVDEDSGPQTITDWASAIRSGSIYEEPFETVTFTVTADDPALFSVQPALAPEPDPGPNATSDLTFTPKPDAFGTTTVTVVAKDDGGIGGGDGTDTADPVTFELTVTNVQDVPVAEDQSAATTEDTFVDVPVTTGSHDADGDTLTVSAVTDGALGTTTIRPGNQIVRYAPAANANGADSFQYTLSDGHGNTASATVNVTIAAENDAPSCSPDSVGLLEDAVANSGVACTDVDAGDTLTYEVVDQPAKGGVSMGTDGSFTYTPNTDVNGADSFTYRALDSSAATSNTATVAVTIGAVDDPPSFTAGGDVAVAEDAGPQTRVGWATAISVGGPDEVFLQTPVFSIVGNTNAGLFSAQPAVSAIGTLTFTGKLNAEGSADITVRLSDGVATVDHTFTITLANVADPPNAVNDTGLTVPALSAPKTLDVLANDLNPDPGETLTIVSVTQGTKGKVAISPGGTAVTYLPTGCNIGSDTFTYTLSDGNGGTDNGTVLLTITRDTQKPTASVPFSAFIAATQLGTSNVPVRVSWCATDPGTGIARYTLQQSTDSKAYGTVTLASAKSTSITRTLTINHRYRFRARATDGDGSVGSFATGANSLVTRVEDASSLVKYTGSWTSVVSGTASGGKVRYTSAANATAAYTFTGRAFAIASPTSSTRGSFNVYVDGVLMGTVSEKTSSTIVRRIVFARTLTPGTHTLNLVAVGNGRIDLDAIVTLS